MRRLIVVPVLLALTSCATVQTKAPESSRGAFPEIGARTTVSVGEVMVTEYDYLAIGGATLRDEVSGSFWMGRGRLDAGTVLMPAVSSGQDVYCRAQQCLRDTDGDGRFDQASTMNAFGLLVNRSDISPAAYRVSDTTIKDGHKYELIYQGIDNGVVRIAYREFTENLARPAYSQDLTYTLTPGADTEVRFRKMSATVHAADNNSIQYTVQSGF